MLKYVCVKPCSLTTEKIPVRQRNWTKCNSTQFNTEKKERKRKPGVALISITSFGVICPKPPQQ